MSDTAYDAFKAVGVACCGNLLLDIDGVLAVINYGSDVFRKLVGEEFDGSAKEVELALAVSAAKDIALENVGSRRGSISGAS